MSVASASAIGRWAALLAVTTAPTSPVMAQDGAPEIRAVTFVVQPFVIEKGGRLTGFSIDLWNEVAARLAVKTSYRVKTEAPAVFDALRTSEADVAVSAIFYTSERDREFDFSYPILNAGLQVMVPSEGRSASEGPLRQFLRVLFSPGMIYWLAAALLLILLPAHVIWLLDRRTEEGVSQGTKYFPAIFDALIWSAEALVSQAQQMPRRRVARLLGILWLFTGVVFVAFFTAQLTATVTVEQLRGSINGPEDLAQRKVGAGLGSPAIPYLRGIGAHVQEFKQVDEMIAALLSRQIDAVVGGAPILRYYASHELLGNVRVVGPEFMRGDLGFVVLLNSPLRKRISSALVTMHEDGTYQRIHEKWFGGG